QLGVLDVDADGEAAGDPGVLQRQVAEATHAEDRHRLGGRDAAHLDRLVSRDARAGQGRGIQGGDAVRDWRGKGRGRYRVLGERAVDRVPGVLLPLAQRLPAADAVPALPARG